MSVLAMPSCVAAYVRERALCKVSFDIFRPAFDAEKGGGHEQQVLFYRIGLVPFVAWVLWGYPFPREKRERIVGSR